MPNIALEPNRASLSLLLYRAAYNDDLLTARQALDGGADPNFVNQPDGLSPAAFALFHHSPAMLRLLRSAGFDPNAQNREGQGALHKCISMGRCIFAPALLQWGADPNLLDACANTPLHLAAACCAPCCQALLRAGADPSIPNLQGLFPADLAARAGLSANRLACLRLCPQSYSPASGLAQGDLSS